MDVINSRVRQCIKESKMKYKNKPDRNYKTEMYIVPLSVDHPFERDEFVKVVRKEDFDKIGDVLKKAKSDKEQLK